MKKHLPLLLLLNFSVFCVLQAQWTTSGPYGTIVYCDLKIGSSTYIGTSTGVYKTTDSGQTWKQNSVNLPAGLSISAMYFDGVTMYAGMNGQLDRVFTSADTGITWTLHNTGLNATTGYQGFCQVGNKVFVTYAGGISYTNNSGASWASAVAPFNNTGYIYYDGKAMYATETYGGPVAISYDTAQSWLMDTTGMGGSPKVGRLFFTPDGTFAVGDYLYVTDAGPGSTWTSLSGPSNAYFGKICFDGNSTFYESTGGANGLHVLKFTLALGGDTTWIDVTGQLPPGNVNDLFAIDYGIFIALDDRLYVTSDEGGHWIQTNNNGLSMQPVISIYADEATLYGGTNSGVYRSPGLYAPWILENDSFSSGNITNIHRLGAYLYAASNSSGIYLSADGITWLPADSGLDISASNVFCFADDGLNIYAGTGGASVYISDSITWSLFGTGLPSGQVNDLLVNGQYIYAACSPLNSDTPSVYRSSLTSPAWASTGTGLPPGGAVAFANYGDTLYVSLGNSGIYQSVNSGSNWTSISIGLPQTITVNDLLTIGDTLFAATDSGVYQIRVDTSSTWQAFNQGLGNLNIHQLSYSDSLGYLFAATDASVWQISSTAAVINDIQKVNLTPLTAQVYPNPSSTGSWHLEINDQAIGSSLQIYTVEGQLVYRSEISSSRSEINLNISAGIYFLRLTNNNAVYTTKLVKD